MKIAVCDDELVQAEYISSLLKKWADQNNKLVTIEIFESTGAFLFAWSEDKSYDLLLLDIQMPGQNGMELAKFIRQSDDTLLIVFITGYSDYIEEGYEVSALHYLIKPVKEEKLFTCLNKAYKKIKDYNKAILVECNGESLHINQHEIVCVEAFAHSVVISTMDDRYEIKLNIGQLEKELDSNLFFRPHRSYIVGLKYIKKIGKSQITLDNDNVVPVSRQRYNEVNKAFINFYRGDK